MYYGLALEDRARLACPCCHAAQTCYLRRHTEYYSSMPLRLTFLLRARMYIKLACFEPWIYLHGTHVVALPIFISGPPFLKGDSMMMHRLPAIAQSSQAPAH